MDLVNLLVPKSILLKCPIFLWALKVIAILVVNTVPFPLRYNQIVTRIATQTTTLSSLRLIYKWIYICIVLIRA
jgi:hypothetical protein